MMVAGQQCLPAFSKFPVKEGFQAIGFNAVYKHSKRGGMKTLRSRLPPLKSLIAFEAVARHLSLTKAGQELFISREAVSRQIRILEEHLGIKLFDRLHRAVGLTKAGKEFLAVIQVSLESIADVSGAIQKKTQPLKITISATVAISSFWLTSRLISYKSDYPQAELRVVVSDKPVDLNESDIDIGFRYGNGHWPGLTAIKLFDITSFPVCSPEYLKKSPPIRSSIDLLDHNLINLDGEIHAHEDWQWWLKGHGVPLPASFKTLGFDNYNNVIQVALDGQGIALGFSGLVSDLLAANKLVQPLDTSLSRSEAVYLVLPNRVEQSEQAKSFIDWVLEESERVNSFSNPTAPPLLV
ncbi:LysR substrate-binding domain-containing protein [Dasania marina]|uniref:LysR substrate-binding domain-containing protein n=1 Tax=Dasania marina TaxID=471499 RepID=UPI0030DB377C|tara:strand:- start:55174 stop:56232 length:1059 start_codon:yes stop_codon:yes gene_type:complete